MTDGAAVGVGSLPRSALLLANALCLDAPVVCVLWAAGIGRAFPPGPGIRELVLLAAGVWLGYSADRLADGLRVPLERAGTARHRFAITHRRSLVVAWGLVAVLAAGVAPSWLGAELAPWAVLVAALAALHTWTVHRWPARARLLLPRELVVGVLLAWATAAFAVGGLPRGEVLVATCGLASVFALDCWTISLAERDVDRRRGEASLPRSRYGGEGGFRAASVALLASFGTAAFACADSVLGDTPGSRLWSCLALAVILLGAVVVAARDRELRPVAADLALCASLAPLGAL